MTPSSTPYGLWDSTLDFLTAASLKVSVSTLRSWKDDYFWIEGRPDLKGRRVVVRYDDQLGGQIVSPEGVSLTSRVHEYGGGAMEICDLNGPVVIGIHEDQSLVRFAPGDTVSETIAPAVRGVARGGISWIPNSNWVVVVEEVLGEVHVHRSWVAFNVENHSRSVLAEGRDFYADLSVCPDGCHVAWCEWDHPSMPWESGEVWTASISTTTDAVVINDRQRVAGGIGRPAGRPQFCRDGSLLYLLEDGEWAQPWERTPVGLQQPLTQVASDFGGPLWVLGERQLAEIQGSVIAIERTHGFGIPVIVRDHETKQLDPESIATDELCQGGDSVAWISPTPTTMASLGIAPNGDPRLVVTHNIGPAVPLHHDDIAIARAVSGAGRHGDPLHGLFYPPTNQQSVAPHGEQPPVIAFCHGGPTASARAGFDPVIQSMTSRGFAVVSVNYGGSTGYGASYRHRLDRQWGIVDVEDCVDLVAALGEQGLVDPSRAGIRGGSAGGFTALLGLTTGAFRCAVSWYGVADLLTLAESTHDFESRYLDRLLGELPAERQRYIDRSPVTQASKMQGAVLLLQGLDDPVVPPAQARLMAEALRKNGHDVTLLEFEGESHGFRKLETIQRCLEAEVSFYQRQLCQKHNEVLH